VGRGRLARGAEFAALFVVLPLALYLGPRHAPALFGTTPPVLPTLALLGAALAVALARDPTFDPRRELAWAVPRDALRSVLRRFALLGGGLTALVVVLTPGVFLSLPRERPLLFALVAVGYPVLSVVPQELAFRLWLRRRYSGLFGREAGFVAASAVAFGWAHVIFGNLLAIGLTLVGGALFAETYRRTGSLALVVLEHALYGLLVFTVGLGPYFYGGTLQALE